MLSGILLGLQGVMDPIVFLWILFGTTIGIIVAALPGLSGTMGMALLIPLSFNLDPLPGIAMLSAMYCAANYGGSISAILINTPGTPAAAATVFDGYPMAKKGLAGKALGTACIVSSIGGLFSAVVLIFLAPQLAKIAIQFGPAEYFTLTVFALSMVAGVGSKSTVKALAAMGVGLSLSLVGTDPINGFPRLTFGNADLINGIDFIPVMIGLFAMAEVFSQAMFEKKVEFTASNITGLLPSLKEILAVKTTIMRSALWGVFIGILPAEGGTVAAFIGYSDAKRRSKTPEKFGTGILEGIAASETANNAATGGAMVPTLALGIPGSSGTAVLLGALMLHGLKPGPLLFTQQPKLVYTVFIGIMLANMIFLFLGLAGAKVFAQITRLPARYLNPIVLLLCIIGSYAINLSIADVWIMLIFGIIGYFMKKHGFSSAALVIGVILGGMVETSLRRALMMFDNNPLVFFTRPWAALFIVLLALQIVQQVLAGRKAKAVSKQ